MNNHADKPKRYIQNSQAIRALNLEDDVDWEEFAARERAAKARFLKSLRNRKLEQGAKK